MRHRNIVEDAGNKSLASCLTDLDLRFEAGDRHRTAQQAAFISFPTQAYMHVPSILDSDQTFFNLQRITVFTFSTDVHGKPPAQVCVRIEKYLRLQPGSSLVVARFDSEIATSRLKRDYIKFVFQCKRWNDYALCSQITETHALLWFSGKVRCKMHDLKLRQIILALPRGEF